MKCRNILFKSFSFTIYLFYQLENSLLLQSEETGKLRRPGRIQDPQVISLSKLCPNSDSFGPLAKITISQLIRTGQEPIGGAFSLFQDALCSNQRRPPNSDTSKFGYCLPAFGQIEGTRFSKLPIASSYPTAYHFTGRTHISLSGK